MVRVDRNASGVIETIRLIDSAGDPLDGETAATVVCHYRLPGADDWEALTLDAGTLATFVSGSLVAMPNTPLARDGTYQFCPPDAWIVAGKRTAVRFKVGANAYQYDAIEAVNSVALANSEEIADQVLAGISAIRAQLVGYVDNGSQTDITLTQNTDWNSTDGHALEFAIVDAGVDFTSATAIFGTSLVDGESLSATATIENGTVGSCTVRLEFSAANVNKPVGTYQFNVIVAQPGDGDRLPGVRGSIVLAEDYTTA